MANEKRMDSVILGLLNHEPMTGYEIKKRIDTSLSFFWSGSYGSIYPTLRMLEDKDYVTKQNASEGKREKIVYSITETGRKCLKSWLCERGAKDELRYETLLKLFFGGSLSKEETIQIIDEFQIKCRSSLQMLKTFEESLEAYKDNSDHLNYLLTVKFGIESYCAYLRWCEDAKGLLNQKYNKVK